MARVSALGFRLLLGLTVIIQSLVGPATPIQAQPAPPTVEFSPLTVAAGGSILVSGTNYRCLETISVRVVNLSGVDVADLGTLTVCTTFATSFTLPASVVPGNYRIRAVGGTIDEVQRAISGRVLTVTDGGGTTTGELSGIARCNFPPLTVLSLARVTVFSGSALVASTTANADGAWTIDGSAPQANYVVRYQEFEGSRGCGVGVTTNSDGFGTAGVPSACPSPDLSNRTWLTPAVVAASATGTTISDSICKAGESRWYRVPVLPGQQVSAEVLDPHLDVTLALFKDIRQVADEMNAAQAAGLTLEDVRRFTASNPQDVGAPDVGSPDVGSPDVGSPDVGSPDVGSPDVGSPDVGSPDVGSPDVGSPDVGSPDVGSPDVGSPDVGSPDAYTSAQLQAILAYSDKPGPSSEFVRRHTWDNTGSFYVRVRGHNDAFDETTPFSLRIVVVNRDCTDNSGTRLPLTTSFTPSFSGLPTNTPRTLILTNTARFGTGADTAGLMASLNAFAARREIGGAVVDLAGDAGLASAYTQWDNIPDCVPAANIVADQIHRIEERVRLQNSASLQYVVLVGGDHVIPFQRLPDLAGLANERDFDPAVFDFSPSQASLKTGYFLSQDSYGSFKRISRGDHITPSFDVAVGRLVETVSDIQTMLSTYTTTGGLMQPTTALVTGYDFLADSAALISTDLQQAGVTVDSLIQPEFDGPLATTAWRADDLRGRLFGTNRYGLLELNAHFSSNTMLASDFSTRMRSAEVAAVTDGRFRNTLILSMGCHSGYNIVDPEATPGTPPVDWAQAFAHQGGTVIGGAGYQYGNTPLIKYAEVLMSEITHQLRLFDGSAPGPVTLGRAILEAKRAYVRGGMNTLDEKSVAELTLYGLPMTSVNLPSGRIPRPGAPPLVTPSPDTHNAGLAFADLTPSYTLTGRDRVLNLLGGGTVTTTYFDATYAGQARDTQTNPGQPILPQVVTPLKADATLARGAIMLSANYTDLTSSLGGTNAFRPLVDNALTEVKGIRPAYLSSIFGPAQLVSVNDLQDQLLVERPFQFRSNGNSVFGTGRRYDTIATRVYYSNRTDASALAGPPTIYTTSLNADATRLNIDVAVGGLRAADVEDVFATFTSDPTIGGNSLYGRWDSLALTAGPTINKGVGFIRHYTGVLETRDTGATPQSIRLFIQAVSGNGLVSVSTNNGNNFHLITETATLGSPKLATSVAFSTSPGSLYSATYRVPLRVTARLTNSLTSAGIGGKALTFSLGRSTARAITAADGSASADVPVLLSPDQPLPQVTVAFAEDDQYLGSADRRGVTINRAPTGFVLTTPASIPYGGSANIATLNVLLPSGNKPLREVGVRITLEDGRQLDTLTDGFGRVLFDTLDFGGVQPGAHVSTLEYFGNDRYLPTSVAPRQTVVSSGNRSLALTGTGFAEAPHAPDLNLTRDWTLELWFKDQHPNGFNHDYVTLLNKGDREANPESPYFVTLGNKQLLVGQRVNWVDYAVTYDLFGNGVDPKAWHHLAATFSAPTRTLTLYLDGVRVKQEVLGAISRGNTLPVEIGRNGAVSGKYFRGKLDDVRLWNVVRTDIQIAGSFSHELTSPQSRLVANWQFNELLGTFFAYSTVGVHTAALSTSGASFSTDHP